MTLQWHGRVVAALQRPEGQLQRWMGEWQLACPQGSSTWLGKTATALQLCSCYTALNGALPQLPCLDPV